MQDALYGALGRMRGTVAYAEDYEEGKGFVCVGTLAWKEESETFRGSPGSSKRDARKLLVYFWFERKVRKVFTLYKMDEPTYGVDAYSPTPRCTNLRSRGELDAQFIAEFTEMTFPKITELTPSASSTPPASPPPELHYGEVSIIKNALPPPKVRDEFVKAQWGEIFSTFPLESSKPLVLLDCGTGISLPIGFEDQYDVVGFADVGSATRPPTTFVSRGGKADGADFMMAFYLGGMAARGLLMNKKIIIVSSDKMRLCICDELIATGHDATQQLTLPPYTPQPRPSNKQARLQLAFS